MKTLTLFLLTFTTIQTHAGVCKDIDSSLEVLESYMCEDSESGDKMCVNFGTNTSNNEPAIHIFQNLAELIVDDNMLFLQRSNFLSCNFVFWEGCETARNSKKFLEAFLRVAPVVDDADVMPSKTHFYLNKRKQTASLDIENYSRYLRLTESISNNYINCKLQK